MKVLIALILTSATFAFIASDWGILAFGTGAIAVYILTRKDWSASLDAFFACGMGIGILAGIVAFIQALSGA